jgi:hypothetical protein
MVRWQTPQSHQGLQCRAGQVCAGYHCRQRFSGACRIVFVVVNDPAEQGFILSMAHPGGNVTGFLFIDFPLFGRSLQLLKQMAPGVIRVGFMFRPADHPYYGTKLKSFAADRQLRRGRRSARIAAYLACAAVDADHRLSHLDITDNDASPLYSRLVERVRMGRESKLPRTPPVCGRTYGPDARTC